MFDKMSDKEVTELGNCLRGVVERTAGGADPEEELAKEAIRKDFNFNKIARLCEAYNKAVSVREICSRPLGEKGEDINLVDMQKVAQRIVGTSKEATEEAFISIPDLAVKDLEALAYKRERQLISKLAEEKFSSAPPSKDAQWTREWKAKANKEAKDNNERMAGKLAKEELIDMIDKLAYEVRKNPSFIDKYASDVATRHGHQGTVLMKLASSLNRLPEPSFKRTGGKMPVPGVAGKLVEDIMEKKAFVDSVVKGATMSVPKLLAPQLLPDYKKEVDRDDYSISPTGRKYRNINTTLSEELARVDKFRKMLTLYKGDRFFKGRSLPEVMKAFDFASEQLPHVDPILNRSVFSSVMRKYMQSGEAGVDSFDMQQMAQMDKLKTESDRIAAQTESEVAKDIKLREELAPGLKGTFEGGKSISEIGKGITEGLSDAIKEIGKITDKDKGTSKDDKDSLSFAINRSIEDKGSIRGAYKAFIGAEDEDEQKSKGKGKGKK